MLTYGAHFKLLPIYHATVLLDILVIVNLTSTSRNSNKSLGFAKSGSFAITNLKSMLGWMKAIAIPMMIWHF